MAGHVAERHVVRHDEERVDVGRQRADVHEPLVPTRGSRVSVDTDHRRRPALVHLRRELGDEVGELRRQVRIAGIGAPLEVDVDTVEATRRDRIDDVGDRGLGQARGTEELVERRIVGLLDHQHRAVARLMRAVEGIGQGLAGPAGPAGVRRAVAVHGVEVAVAVEVQPEIGDGAEQRVVPVRVVVDFPVGREAEDLASQLGVRARRQRPGGGRRPAHGFWLARHDRGLGRRSQVERHVRVLGVLLRVRANRGVTLRGAGALRGYTLERKRTQ